MKKFNKDKYLRKLKIKRFFRNNSRYFYIVLSCLLCCFLGIYFTYSKFFISDEQAVIRTTVGDFTRGDIILNIYVDGKKVSEAPKKNTGYSMKNISCNNGNVVWNDDNWKLTVTNISGTTKCDIYFIEAPVYKYYSTAKEETLTIQKTGLYKLETWGAQGGSINTTSIGGYGAYANGFVYLTAGDILYINVGSSTTTTTGGYNGGGTGGILGGGGATHIALKTGIISELENKLYSILIIASGGGGSGKSGSGGSGGGISGNTGLSGNCSDKGGFGGTQTAGGSSRDGSWGGPGTFGQGGEFVKGTTGGGGGSGYYGGGAGTSGDCYGGGGGGSSYIGNSLLTDKVMYCYNCTESKETVTKTLTTTCNEETPTEDCAKKGDGYAKISYLSTIDMKYYISSAETTEVPDKEKYTFIKADCSLGTNLSWNETTWKVIISNFQENDSCILYFTNRTTYNYEYIDNNEKKFTAPKSGYYKLETWGAQGGGTTTYQGGYGAYSNGIVRLKKDDKLYINVGEAGTIDVVATDTFAYTNGGYNGGGNSISGGDTILCGGGSGGGATHIATKSGLLSTLEKNQDNILIVAAGGGGANVNIYNNYSVSHAGSSGGGISSTAKSGETTSCTIASQKTGSSFGQGGNYVSVIRGAAGGGGGYYGGGGGYINGPGCGGSSYIGNSLLINKDMYCYNCTTSTDYDTKTQTTTCSEATPTKNCSKKGNGYAKISYLPITIDYYIEDEKIETIPNKDNYILKEMSCEKSSNITWNYNIWNVDISDYQENDTCKIVFKSSKVAKIINQLDTTGKCPTVSTNSSITLSGVETSNNYVCSIPDTYGTSYYYRGNVTNNYVKFANLYWRIIRVNGDESIRVIYDGTIAHANGESSTDRHIGTSKFNSSNNDNTYVGYMYGNKGATSYNVAHTNTNDSAIKSYLDSWYKTNIIDKNYDSYVVDNIFCNDRSIKSGNGYGTSGTNYRWYYLYDNASNNKTAILKCLQQNDAFTVSDTTNGNGKLTYPIGLITSDEAFLAGGNGAENSKYYLYTGSSYWTMSPNRALSDDKIVKINVIYGSGYASYGHDVAVNAYVKPVINLKSDVLKNGNGTLDNPYHLSEEE